jgi:shikimate dehydrogenase
LANIFQEYGNNEALRFSDIAPHSIDIVINGSSASLMGELPPLAAEFWLRCLCLRYGLRQANLPFLDVGKAQQATSDGLGMLIEQAAESFFIWRGLRVQTAELLAEIDNKLHCLICSRCSYRWEIPVSFSMSDIHLKKPYVVSLKSLNKAHYVAQN